MNGKARGYGWRTLAKELETENDRLLASSADDLRALGWSVAVHNDYRLNGEPHTFWLFTKGTRCLKGEGRTDAEALAQVRRQVMSLTAERDGGKR